MKAIVVVFVACVAAAAGLTTPKPAVHTNAPTHHINVNGHGHLSAQKPASHTNGPAPHTAQPPTSTQDDKIKAMEDTLHNSQLTIEALGNQLMQQQTFVEERIRSDGMSGVKTLRLSRSGTKPYYGSHHVGSSALSVHDHADYDRTIGMGEFVAVMNGVEFRTRHNDYKLRMSSSDHTYNKVVDIPFPGVPDAVKSKGNIQDMIVEMRQWFKAFKTQNETLRPYKNYFKANLCYLEGAWTLNTKTLNEPFQSDRHHIDAASWFELQDKIRFSSYGGSKSNLENFSFLPTMLYNISGGVPQFAQWNYRILCHPVRDNVPTNYFQLQDDLTYRLAHKKKWEDMETQRAARYKLNEFGTDRAYFDSLLDKIMGEIPGKNNYGANLTDDSFGLLNYDIKDPTCKTPLNVGNYHRWFKLAVKGAMGLTVNHRGYHDENMWVAHTTQPNVMPLSMHHCHSTPTSRRECSWATKRVSYAIPLEIVYTTPLSNWNPYDIPHWGSDGRADAVVHAHGRNGLHNITKAYNGTSFKHYYRTPVEFYKGNAAHDAADTARNSVAVLNRKGEMKSVAPTGTRVTTPNIDGVGVVRLRYPIFPVHTEGSTVGMELMALKEMVMKMSHNQALYEETPMGKAMDLEEDKTFKMMDTHHNPPGLHGHEFTLTSDEYKQLLNGTHLMVTTSFNLGHQHELEIYYWSGNQKYAYRKCDGANQCWDRHAHEIRLAA